MIIYADLISRLSMEIVHLLITCQEHLLPASDGDAILMISRKLSHVNVGYLYGWQCFIALRESLKKKEPVFKPALFFYPMGNI